VRDVKTLQSEAVVGYSEHRSVGETLHSGDVESEQTAVAFYHLNNAQVCKFGAVGQRESLNAFATLEWLKRSIADQDSEAREVEAFNEVGVIVVGVYTAERLNDIVQSFPSLGLRPMPKESDAVSGPLSRDEHA